MLVYEILTNTDLNEGKGLPKGTGIHFISEVDAKDFIYSDRYKPYAVMGVVPRRDSTVSWLYKKVNLNLKIYTSLQNYDEDQAPNYDGQIREIDGRMYKLVLR